VPDGPLPSEDVPAPVRFLPEFDNAVLSHADRSRFFAGDERPVVRPDEPRIGGTVLHDGLVRAVWRWDGDDLVVTHFPLPRAGRDEVAAEGAGVLALHGRSGCVRLVPTDR
jgi:hypothetical protein